jgi:hypothetical protein
MFGTQGLWWKKIDWKSTRRFAEYLEKIVRKFSFQSSKGGEAWNPQPPQGSFNLHEQVWPLRDRISLCGRWRASKKQVDTYIDVVMPYPDAKVVSILCNPRGPCKYAARDGVDLYDDFLYSIAP